MWPRMLHFVGWVECHETHHAFGQMVGLAELDPPYGLQLQGDHRNRHYSPNGLVPAGG